MTATAAETATPSMVPVPLDSPSSEDRAPSWREMQRRDGALPPDSPPIDEKPDEEAVPVAATPIRRHLTRRVTVNVEGQDGIGDILVGAGTAKAVRRVREVHQNERAEERGKARKARPRRKGRIKVGMMMDGV